VKNFKFKNKKVPTKNGRSNNPSQRGHKPAAATKTASPPAELPTVIGTIVKDEKGRWKIEVSNRRDKRRYFIRASKGEAREGMLVAARRTNSVKNGAQGLEITETLGDPNDPKLFSLIALKSRDMRVEFPQMVLNEADRAQPVELGSRTDLRDVPLVTIDGPDARDFDDAVFAERAKDGWHLMVAIADVSHYVQPHSALDCEAFERGNSTYFPDRVVPMLPEALSNGLCSLMPNVDRACMAVHMWIDDEGELKRWKFERGLMKSHARLTYEQVQQAKDGHPCGEIQPLMKSVITPLYGAFGALATARSRRGTLELDLPERKVALNKDGTVRGIRVRERLDSHRLIEEFMIAANVAAASQLETPTGSFCLYRVHDRPSDEKIAGLRLFLQTIGLTLPEDSEIQPNTLTNILNKVSGTQQAQIVSEMILRSQSQAVYSPDNLGHFGLALKQYAHFTSPIRRYADLVVHRALIRQCKLGAGGLSDHELETLTDIGDHISKTERTSAAAERDATDRYTTAYLAEKVGCIFDGQISGLMRTGLFVRLTETGADGLINFKSLPNDYYFYDEARQAMIGEKHGHIFQLGSKVRVKLEEADSTTGTMNFRLMPDEKPQEKARLSRERTRSIDIRAGAPKLT